MPGLRQSVTGCVRAWSKNGGESLCRSTFRPRRRGFEASHLVLCKPGRLCYTLPAREHLFRLFLGSSAVEHSTVNRMVAGSNPARGAICITKLSHPIPSCPLPFAQNACAAGVSLVLTETYRDARRLAGTVYHLEVEGT